MKASLLIACCWSLGTASAQELNTHLPLVRQLDAMRLPSQDFTARLKIRKTKAGASAAEESCFRQYSRRRVETGGRVVLDTLVVCSEPRRDAGKMILFIGDSCWFYDSHAKRATRLPAQQVAAQAVVAELMNWRFAADFDHRLVGREMVAVAGKAHECSVFDFTPKPGVNDRSALVRCWMDAAGRPWKAEHYTASKKVFRTVSFTKYEIILGAEHAVGLAIQSRGDLEEVTLTDAKPGRSPDEYFDPGQLPKILIPAP